MVKVIVDNIEVSVPSGANVLQACEAAGVEIPRFCYHDCLSVAGNCRMCLVQLEDQRGMAPKPVASCATPVSDGLIVHTNNTMVRNARKGVMEFLLINHPLDCPICDQGGECDLQDQAMGFGMDRTRYAENKRAVDEKQMGPLIKTIMTRCIQCTRCVRFATEIAGVEEIGLLNRGEKAEISTLERAVHSELSGNLIDVCPVGALTSRPYAFAARPWELQKTPSIDVMDALGSNIRIDTRGREVLRVLPRLNETINEEWLADKSRYAIDGLKRQRLDRPYIRENGALRVAGWDEALAVVHHKLTTTQPERIGAITGDMVDAEAMFALKSLMQGLGDVNLDCRQDGAQLGGERGSYLFNTGIEGIERADVILLIGSNPRWEAPLVNARIRKAFLSGYTRIAGIGAPVDLTYEVEWLGADANKMHSYTDVLKSAQNPVIIIGMGALQRDDGAVILNTAFELAKATGVLRSDWNGFNVLHTAAARVAGLDLGFLPHEGGLSLQAMPGQVDVLFSLAADEVDYAAFKDTFVIYQGHHGDAGAHAADVILPGAAYTEKNATYVNTEGRVQLARMALFPPGDAREDWTILRALAGACGIELGFDNLAQLRQAMVAQVPHMAAYDEIAPSVLTYAGQPGHIDPAPLCYAIENYYMTDPISRSSQIMAECTAAFVTQHHAASVAA